MLGEARVEIEDLSELDLRFAGRVVCRERGMVGQRLPIRRKGRKTTLSVRTLPSMTVFFDLMTKLLVT